MKIWSVVWKKLKLPNSTTTNQPTKQKSFYHLLWTQDSTNGLNRGLYTEQVFNGQTIKSFVQLQREFNLPDHNFFKFLQLRLSSETSGMGEYL